MDDDSLGHRVCCGECPRTIIQGFGASLPCVTHCMTFAVFPVREGLAEAPVGEQLKALDCLMQWVNSGLVYAGIDYSKIWVSKNTAISASTRKASDCGLHVLYGKYLAVIFVYSA